LDDDASSVHECVVQYSTVRTFYFAGFLRENNLAKSSVAQANRVVVTTINLSLLLRLSLNHTVFIHNDKFTMVKAKHYAPAKRKVESTDGTGGYVPGRWTFSGALICIFCYANLRYLKSVDIYALMAIEESAIGVVSSINNSISKQTQLSTFCQKIHQAQDFFDPVKEARRKMANVFVANSGHMALLRNSLVSIQRLPTPWKSVVFALDAMLCPDLHQQSPELKVVCFNYGPRLLEQMERDEPKSYHEYLEKSAQETTLNETATWGSGMHKVLINAKLYGLRDVLHCGLDAFLTDADIVYLKDPRPYFVGEDIIAQNDTNPAQNQLNMNSGFMYWRHTQLNLNLSQSLVKDMVWWHIDQARVNTLLSRRGINVTLLHTTQFPNGAVLPSLKTLNATVAVHVNWNDNFDQKKEVMRNRSLWFID
jgi:Nucleotide-diphospho-sugar transferase